MERLEKAYSPPRRIQLVPADPLSCARREAVVVVVPPLTEYEQCDDHVVAAGVRGCESAALETVRERVDGERRVVEQDRGEEEAPLEQLRSRGVQRRIGV